MEMIIGTIVAVLLIIWRVFASGKEAGISKQVKKEAKQYDEKIKKIVAANTARSAVTNSLPVKDKYRRD